MIVNPGVYENAAFPVAGNVQKSKEKEEDAKLVAAPGGDTVAISDAAKELSKAMPFGKSPDQEEQQSGLPDHGQSFRFGGEEETPAADTAGLTPKDEFSAMRGGTDGAKSSTDAAQEQKEAILKQIKEVQKKLAEAKEKLEEALAEQNAQAEDGLLAEESPQVKALQAEISALTNQLMELQKQLEKMQEKGSAGGHESGNVEGTRAGGAPGGNANDPTGQLGFGKYVGAVKGNIGSAT